MPLPISGQPDCCATFHAKSNIAGKRSLANQFTRSLYLTDAMPAPLPRCPAVYFAHAFDAAPS